MISDFCLPRQKCHSRVTFHLVIDRNHVGAFCPRQTVRPRVAAAVQRSRTADGSHPQTRQAEVHLATTRRENVIAKVANQHLTQHSRPCFVHTQTPRLTQMHHVQKEKRNKVFATLKTHARQGKMCRHFFSQKPTSGQRGPGPQTRTHRETRTERLEVVG